MNILTDMPDLPEPEDTQLCLVDLIPFLNRAFADLAAAAELPENALLVPDFNFPSLHWLAVHQWPVSEFLCSGHNKALLRSVCDDLSQNDECLELAVKYLKKHGPDLTLDYSLNEPDSSVWINKMAAKIYTSIHVCTSDTFDAWINVEKFHDLSGKALYYGLKALGCTSSPAEFAKVINDSRLLQNTDRVFEFIFGCHTALLREYGDTPTQDLLLAKRPELVLDQALLWAQNFRERFEAAKVNYEHNHL